MGCVVGGAVIWWIHSLDRDRPPAAPRERVIDAHGIPATISPHPNPAAEFEPLPRTKSKPSQIRNDGAQLSALGRHADDWKE